MRGYSIRTEKTYLYWIKAFINCHNKHHPETMGTEEVTQFLAFLANQLHGRNRFIIELLYGSGLRVSECLRLRVQDIDIESFADR
ncbi:TPA: phage integrase N-terminal SAM-like domain-containing protein [Vibrio parahaemolyticus]|nr:phage integrase N-terminal SAM-like domain-containing protein [Vibrio parahaemolyticus]